jgi:hypothetical protein
MPLIMDLQGSMSNYRSALDILDQLAAADPTNADARRLLALGYKKVGGAQEVGAIFFFFGKVLRIEPRNEECLQRCPNP